MKSENLKKNSTVYMGCGDRSINEVRNNALKVNFHTIRRVVGKLKSCYGYGMLTKIVMGVGRVNGVVFKSDKKI